MTVDQLAARTGLTIKAIRELVGRGLIYPAGRSEGGYRLYDSSALSCCEVIGNLRSLGSTLEKIEQLAGIYLDRPQEPIGPRLAALLDRAERIEERIGGLEQVSSADSRIPRAATGGARGASRARAGPWRSAQGGLTLTPG